MNDNDDAPAGGIPRFTPGKRPLLRSVKGGQETPKSTRPILPAGRQRPTIDFRGNYTQMDNNADNAPAQGIERPKLNLKGTDGTERPRLKLKTMDEIYATPSKQKAGAPFDQDLEPDDPRTD